MTLAGVRAGDIVLADRKGRRFYAVVTERRERELGVEPIDRRVTYRHVKAREVIGIWRKSRAQNGRVIEAVRPSVRAPRRARTVTPPVPEPLVVVCAEDVVDPALTGRAGAVYASPLSRMTRRWRWHGSAAAGAPRCRRSPTKLAGAVRLRAGGGPSRFEPGGEPVAGEAQKLQPSSDRNDPSISCRPRKQNACEPPRPCELRQPRTRQERPERYRCRCCGA